MRATHAHSLNLAALAFVPLGMVLVRVRIRATAIADPALKPLGFHGAGPRQVGKDRGQPPFKLGQLRTTTKRRHQGDPGGQAALG